MYIILYTNRTYKIYLEIRFVCVFENDTKKEEEKDALISSGVV